MRPRGGALQLLLALHVLGGRSSKRGRGGGQLLLRRELAVPRARALECGARGRLHWGPRRRHIAAVHLCNSSASQLVQGDHRMLELELCEFEFVNNSLTAVR
jgi:hypothetical protein